MLPAPRPPARPTLVQYYCTMIGPYTTPLPTSRLYAIHHTILAITISCKGQTPLSHVKQVVALLALDSAAKSAHTLLFEVSDIADTVRKLLAFTRYSFTSRGCCARINYRFIHPPAWIAHPGAIRLHAYWTVCDSLSDLRFVCYTPYNIDFYNIV